MTKTTKPMPDKKKVEVSKVSVTKQPETITKQPYEIEGINPDIIWNRLQSIPSAQKLMEEIEKECCEHETLDGQRFFGTSWNQLERIFEKYGYKSETPF